MWLLNHECLQCGFVSDKEVKKGFITCEQCNTKNDVWQSKFSIPYFRHLIKSNKNRLMKAINETIFTMWI